MSKEDRSGTPENIDAIIEEDNKHGARSARAQMRMDRHARRSHWNGGYDVYDDDGKIPSNPDLKKPAAMNPNQEKEDQEIARAENTLRETLRVYAPLGKMLHYTGVEEIILKSGPDEKIVTDSTINNAGMAARDAIDSLTVKNQALNTNEILKHAGFVLYDKPGSKAEQYVHYATRKPSQEIELKKGQVASLN